MKKLSSALALVFAFSTFAVAQEAPAPTEAVPAATEEAAPAPTKKEMKKNMKKKAGKKASKKGAM